eukprot:359412-Chlamydomonas_euryale.AAC.7
MSEGRPAELCMNSRTTGRYEWSSPITTKAFTWHSQGHIYTGFIEAAQGWAEQFTGTSQKSFARCGASQDFVERTSARKNRCESEDVRFADRSSFARCGASQHFVERNSARKNKC